MAAKDKRFSASEVNKFCYCRLQWYYERRYGAKKLSEWRKERNNSMGWGAAGESPFKRGRKFHTNYTRNHNARLVLRRLTAVIVLAGLLLLLLYYCGPLRSLIPSFIAYEVQRYGLY